MTADDPGDERYALFTAFTVRVSELDEAAWARIDERCAALNDTSPRGLLARAALAAKAREVSVPDGSAQSGMARALKAGFAFLHRGVAIAGELSAQLERSASPRGTGSESVSDQGSSDAPDSNDARSAALMAGHERLLSALSPRIAHAPGVAVAIWAAAEAVLCRDWIAPEAFVAVYRYVEPEIPFASLSRST